MKHYKLKINKIAYETDDALSIYFKQPLLGKISYKSGQFLTLIFTIDNREYKRAYSINSTQGVDQDISITVKKVQGGVISNHIFNHLKIGDKVPMQKPMGNFTLEVQKDKSRDIVLFGAGSGITPLMSILKSTLYFEPESRVTLIYSNKSEDSIIFKEQLDIFKERFADRLFVRHLLSEQNNRLEEELLAEYLDVNPFFHADSALFFLCGPEAYMEAVKAGLSDKLRIPEDRIFNESFTLKKLESEASYEVTFRTPQKEQQANVPAGKSLLDVGLSLGLRMKFSCFNGQCGTCKAKCVTGTVRMAVDNILTQEDKDNGYVLPCVGYPVSEGVVLEVE